MTYKQAKFSLADMEQFCEIGSRFEASFKRPIGLTGEICEFYAERLLGLELTEARQEGYDAVFNEIKFQIKGKAIREKPFTNSSPLSRFKVGHDFDCCLMVLLNSRLQPTDIYAVESEFIFRGQTSRTFVQKSVASIKKAGILVWASDAALNEKARQNWKLLKVRKSPRSSVQLKAA